MCFIFYDTVKLVILDIRFILYVVFLVVYLVCSVFLCSVFYLVWSVFLIT